MSWTYHPDTLEVVDDSGEVIADLVSPEHGRMIAAARDLYGATCDLWLNHRLADPHAPEGCTGCTSAVQAISKVRGK